MYAKRNGLILGFHGCDKSIRDKVVCEKGELLYQSKNDYDWLGSGIYFWENNYDRALEFAKFLRDNPPHNEKQHIKEPAVIGAIIDLGYCLDLLDSNNLNILKANYDLLKEINLKNEVKMPVNVPLIENGDLLKRNLDCAVIESIHEINIRLERPEYDSVRGVFFEGNDLYSNAGFKEKNHIQIAIRNPNSIKGFFIPRDRDKRHKRP